MVPMAAAEAASTPVTSATAALVIEAISATIAPPAATPAGKRSQIPVSCNMCARYSSEPLLASPFDAERAELIAISSRRWRAKSGTVLAHADFSQFGGELRFDRVLQLRPKSAQIGFQQLHSVFHFRLHRFAQFAFNFELEILLPLAL